jgi:ligand-binding sensor protein
MKNKILSIKKDTDIDWHLLERKLCEKYHVHALAIDSEGGRRTHGEIVWANSLCSLLKASSVGEDRIWSLTQRQMCCDARTGKSCVREECPAGLIKIIVPIMIENDVEGFVCVGGRPYVSIGRIYTDKIQRIIGLEKEEIQRCLATIKPIDYRTIKEIMACITSFN